MGQTRFSRAVSAPLSAFYGAGKTVAGWVGGAVKRSMSFMSSDNSVDWRRVFGMPPRKGSGSRKPRRYITPLDVLSIPAYSQALRVLSRGFAQCLIKFYVGTAAGPEEAKWHPVAQFLMQPSIDLDRHQFWSTMITHYKLRNNAYASIARLADGSFNATIMFPEWVEAGNDVVTGEPVYIYKEPGKDPKTLWARDVIHLMGDTFDGRKGLDPIKLHQRSFDLIISTEEYACDYFEKGFTAAGFMSHPGPLDDPARENVQASIRKFRGLDGDDSFGVLVGEEGATFNQINADPDKAQLVASREAGIAEIGRITGVPLSFLMVAGSSYSTAEQEGMRLLSVSIGPILDQVVEQIQCKMMTREERSRYFVAADLDPLLKADSLTYARVCALEANWGVLTSTEWRHTKLRKGLPGGDKPMRPMNMVAMGVDVNPGSAPASSAALVNLDPDAAPGETPIDAVATGGTPDVAATGLNGAQIDKLVLVVVQVVQGMLPLTAGVAILKAAFPLLSEPQINAIFKDVKPGSQAPAPTPTSPAKAA